MAKKSRNPVPARPSTRPPELGKAAGPFKIALACLIVLVTIGYGVHLVLQAWGNQAILLPPKEFQFWTFAGGMAMITLGLLEATLWPHVITDPDIGRYTSWFGKKSSRLLESGIHFCWFPFFCSIETIKGGIRTIKVTANPITKDLEGIEGVEINVLTKTDTTEPRSLREILEYPPEQHEADIEEAIASSVGTIFGKKSTKQVLMKQDVIEGELLAILQASSRHDCYKVHKCEVKLPASKTIASVVASQIRIIGAAENEVLKNQSLANRAGDVELMKAAQSPIAAAAGFFTMKNTPASKSSEKQPAPTEKGASAKPKDSKQDETPWQIIVSFLKEARNALTQSKPKLKQSERRKS